MSEQLLVIEVDKIEQIYGNVLHFHRYNASDFESFLEAFCSIIPPPISVILLSLQVLRKTGRKLVANL